MKLSPKQKEVLCEWRKYPDELCIKLSDGYFLTRGCGVKIPKNTFYALKRLGLIEYDQLSILGKTIEL